MHETLRADIAAQAVRLPQMYGRVDFSAVPERFTEDPKVESAIRVSMRDRRPDLLANKARVDLIQAYTMMGDRVADAYAALMPTFGFKGLVDMLDLACAKGVSAVENAPPELVAFIADMETTPDWIDLDLAKKGAFYERNSTAHVAPFITRGGFVATFMNQYSALPMALTGALTHATAARRVLETATFFALSVLPGGLDRHGDGFKSAAKVRLMHSMVRFNVLRRPGVWDLDVYGVPIPQVDQMPAGLIGPFLISLTALRRGRTSFTPKERAIVELSRYRCFLLGLPKDLIGDTPQSLVDLMLTRHATLKRAFDDQTCGSLVRATMGAELQTRKGAWANVKGRMEKGISKVFFVQSFLDGDYAAAKAVGVEVTGADKAWAGAAGLYMAIQLALFSLARALPGVGGAADRVLVRKLEALVRSYGPAHFTTDAASYRSAHA